MSDKIKFNDIVALSGGTECLHQRILEISHLVEGLLKEAAGIVELSRAITSGLSIEISAETVAQEVSLKKEKNEKKAKGPQKIVYFMK